MGSPPKQVDIAIIGTGTAALSAASEVSKYTDNFILVSNGVYGTTCARVGCMPSKTLIQGAAFFHAREGMRHFGIKGTESLTVDSAAFLRHVRTLRDGFVEYTVKQTHGYAKHIVEGAAYFHSPTRLQVGEAVFSVKRTILATGSSPVMPDIGALHSGKLLNSDTLFDELEFPKSLIVIGLGALGLEMAAAFARLGIKVDACNAGTFLGGLSDPAVNAYVLETLQKEMKITLNEQWETYLKKREDKTITLFLAMSRKPNLENMGLEACGVVDKHHKIIGYNPETTQAGALPMFVAGDARSGPLMLHHAADEGKIAGYNASHLRPQSFKRRTKLQIVYTQPIIAVAGAHYNALDSSAILVGETTFDDQGRAKIMQEARGIIRIYADKKSGRLLGAEMFAPAGDHLGHLLAMMIDRKLTVKQALSLPFYHPTLEEGLRTALANIEKNS